MKNRSIFLIVGFVLILSILGCNLSTETVVTSEPGEAPTGQLETDVAVVVASTQAAQTAEAAAQTAMANDVAATLAAMVTDTPEFTFTPSLTPTPTWTLTPTFTFTPQVPMASVSAQTNCRSGPSTAYDILGVMSVGETAEVVGRSAVNDYWIIKLPSNPAITCWLWGQNATVSGNTAGLPLLNPPPTPTPPITFSVAYVKTIFCSPQYAFTFNITNNGSLTWKSIRITITDNTNPATFIHTNNNFRDYNDCIMNLDQQDLTPGETGPVSNVNPGQIGYNPAGHSFTAVFRLCSEDGLAGTCVEKTLNFNP